MQLACRPAVLLSAEGCLNVSFFQASSAVWQSVAGGPAVAATPAAAAHPVWLDSQLFHDDGANVSQHFRHANHVLLNP
jgi:hypothetical protein